MSDNEIKELLKNFDGIPINGRDEGGRGETTFLAVTKVKPLEPERPEKLEIEKEEIEKGLVECLHYPRLWEMHLFEEDGVEEISTQEKLQRVNKHLDFLHKQKELLEKEPNKEALQKLNREIIHFFDIKKTLLSASLEDMSSLDEKGEIKEQLEHSIQMVKSLTEENKIMYYRRSI